MDRCGLCNRRLRDRVSVELGFGPTCWSRLSGAATAAPLEPLQEPSTRSAPASGRVTTGPVMPTTPVAADRGGRGPSEVASPALAGLSWLVVLAALAALVEYWRAVVIGLAVLGLLAATGAVIEQVAARRHRHGPSSAPRSHRL